MKGIFLRVFLTSYLASKTIIMFAGREKKNLIFRMPRPRRSTLKVR